MSYEKEIIFKKDVAVSDIELDEGIEEKEQNGNVMHNRKAYSLEKGKKYKVIVTIASTDFAANNYSVSFEQNNWVYAPNGGIQTCNISPLGDYKKVLYIPCDYIEKTMTHIFNNGQEYKINDLYDLDQVIKELKINSTDSEELRSRVGNDATIVGAVTALLPGGEIISIIGGTVSVVGAATLSENFDQEYDIKKAELKSVDLNLVISQTRYSIGKTDYKVNT